MSRPNASPRCTGIGAKATALASWQGVCELTGLLFAEPTPAPAKYWLARPGLIARAEVRLPMVDVSADLAARLDLEIENRRLASHAASSMGRSSKHLVSAG